MEICSKSAPEWLEAWLSISFYGNNKCKKHEKHYNIICCGLCMDDPVCELCWGWDKKLHQDHDPILKVCSASRRAAADVNVISKLLDTSKIQEYKINNLTIVYLNANVNAIPDPHHQPNCKACDRRLITDKFLFCSIKCKKFGRKCDMRIEKKSDTEKQQQQQPESLERKAVMSAGFCSLRKTSRKGIPRRAPLK